MVATHTIGHRGRKQRLNSAQHGNDHGCGEKALHTLPTQVGHLQRGNACLYLAKLVADGEHLHVGVGIQKVNAYGHYNNGHERAGHLLRHLGRKGYYHDAQHTYRSGHPVYCVKILKVHQPFRQEVARHFARNGQAEQVLDLRGEYGHGNTARKAHHNGVRNELDDGAKMANAQQYQEDTRQHSGQHQSRQAQIGVAHNTVDNYDESTRRATNLHTATAKGRHNKTANDGGQYTPARAIHPKLYQRLWPMAVPQYQQLSRP